MDLLVSRSAWISVLLLLLFSIFASAQEARVERAENALAMSLDHRTKMFLNAVRKDGGGGGDGLALDQIGSGLFDAFVASLSMILVSEIGDETFIIAALMAMRHPKSIVLSGALSALIVMTILSTGLGRIVPNLMSRKRTNNAATDGFLNDNIESFFSY